MPIRNFVLMVSVAVLAFGQGGDPLAQAYELLKAGNYKEAITKFQEAAKASPTKAMIRKDLAYTYLKIGENRLARDEFAAAMKLDPADAHIALEFAFLCYETGERATARRIFDRIRQTGDPESRATAEKAFQNVDRPLAEGIAHWSKAIELVPNDYSAHLELARLAEDRDELELAAQQYRKTWEIRPSQRSLLLELARVLRAQGKNEEATIALLAASRGPEPRVAEEARQRLPARYPYVYELRDALRLDPGNLDLWHELAYLLLSMGDRDGAEREFRAIIEANPEDLPSVAQLGFLLLERKQKKEAMTLLETVLQSKDEKLAGHVRTVLDNQTDSQKHAKVMAEKSLQAGYLKDALNYLIVASQDYPEDYSVMLKLGWTYNMLHQDAEAIRWFDRARKSPDPAIADEANKAYHNLTMADAEVRTTAWVLPFYSSRWHDAFTYGQVKTEFKLGSLPIEPYLSVRFIGDTRETAAPPAAWTQPQWLSEDAVIVGAGIRTSTWHGVMAWAEAGEALHYIHQPGTGTVVPDYRGGISATKGFGQLLTAPEGGLFAETTGDAVFVSRFQNDALGYFQSRFGYTTPPLKGMGGLQMQYYLNGNATVDLNRQAWANFVEFGPGVRLRWAFMPKALSFSVNLLRGSYTLNKDNPQKPNFYDVRAGFWYALTR
jgi:Flp pilus assembly protein TadD